MLMPQNPRKVFIYIALPCEAKPLVDYFGLKKDTTVKPFAVYCNRDICLTVTGVGKNAMAAGVAYTQALFASVENPVLLNIGIAGHSDHALGGLFLIDKIIDADSQKNYYPPLVFTPPCPAMGIRTASKPQLDYSQPCLYDMEASAFYETAARFTTGELIHCLKVVSDNKEAPAETIRPQQVAALIAAHLAAIEGVIDRLGALAARLIEPTPPLFEPLLQQYYFTASEKIQLRNLLRRWEVMTGQSPVELDQIELDNGKAVLKWLTQQLNKTDFYL